MKDGLSQMYSCMHLQVAKANIEKAEVKANMTQERLIIAQELTVERDRSANLEQTVRLLREQADIYQVFVGGASIKFI